MTWMDMEDKIRQLEAQVAALKKSLGTAELRANSMERMTGDIAAKLFKCEQTRHDMFIAATASETVLRRRLHRSQWLAWGMGAAAAVALVISLLAAKVCGG